MTHYFNSKELLKEERLDIAQFQARKWRWPVWDFAYVSFYERENRTALLRGFSFMLDGLPRSMYCTLSERLGLSPVYRGFIFPS